jgi:hypothetical protein
MGYIVPSKKLLEKEKMIEGKVYTIDIIKDVRSNQQNKYLWVAFQLIADWYNNGGDNLTGEFYSSEKAKGRALYEVGHCDFYLTCENGMQYGIIKPTKNLNKTEFSELVERIINHYAVKGLVILTPQEYFET